MKKLITLTGILLISLSLAGCNSNNYDYDDFNDHFLESFADVYTQEGTYLVYFYSEYCSDCSDLKQDILTYLDNYEETEFYLISDQSSSDQFLYEDFYVTPTLFVIEDGVITTRYLSSVQILEFIE